LNREIDGILNDLKGIKNQLSISKHFISYLFIEDIETKEEELAEEINSCEARILQKGRLTNEAKEAERQKKTAEELARANEQIKNMIQTKQNDKEERRLELTHERDALEHKKKKIEDKLSMIGVLIAERKQIIASKAVQDNKNGIAEQIGRFYEVFKQSKVFCGVFFK